MTINPSGFSIYFGIFCETVVRKRDILNDNLIDTCRAESEEPSAMAANSSSGGACRFSQPRVSCRPSAWNQNLAL